MKSMSAALKLHYQGKVVTIATCWKVTRTDGVIEGYTNHVNDIIYNSVTYASATGYTASNIQSSADLSVDNMDVYCLLDSAGISSTELIAGIYDYAAIEIFEVNYTDLTQGVVTLRSGVLGEIAIKDNIFTAEMRSLSQLLQQTVGAVITPTCRADLGDTRCSIILDPSAWAATSPVVVGDIRKAANYDARRYICSVAGTTDATEPAFDTTIGNTTIETGGVEWITYDTYTYEGSITTVTDRRIFAAAGIVKPDNHFNGGKITWLTGSNAGYSMEVKSYAAAGGVFILFQNMPASIAVTDTFKVTVGCDKIITTCQSFSPENGAQGNIYNFRGEPFLPGNDKVMKFGGQ